jgi:hypothetical protein
MNFFSARIDAWAASWPHISTSRAWAASWPHISTLRAWAASWPHISTLRAWAASWPHISTLRAWAALARAVILAIIGWFLWPVASAQTLGLSSNDIIVVNRLSTEALKHSSNVLNTQRDLENTQFEEGAFGQVLKSLNVTIGCGVGASDPFEQANVRGSGTVSVNLSSLTANLNAPSKVQHARRDYNTSRCNARSRYCINLVHGELL